MSTVPPEQPITDRPKYDSYDDLSVLIHTNEFRPWATYTPRAPPPPPQLNQTNFF